MKPFLFFILFLFSMHTGFSQNLVLNPSFENFTTCPIGPGQFNTYVQTWVQPYPQGPGCSTADYFNGCSGPWVGVPVNMLGNQNALTGVAYAGIMLFDNDPNAQCLGPKGSNYREYIEGTLSSPLTAGATYSVSFNINLPEDVMAATSDIGLYFSNTAVNDPCPAPLVSTVLPYVNQLQYAGPAVTNTTGWTLIQWNYTAVGGEQYFVIGNYKNDANSTSICANAVSQNHFAYYYIDDVTVELVTPSTTLSAAVTGSNLLCNGSCVGTATVTPTNGTAPLSYLWSNGQTTLVSTGLCAGNYSVVVTDASSATATANAVISQPAAITATTSVTQSSCGLSTGTASVSASGGTSPFIYSWSNGQTTSVAAALAAGSYSCVLTDANGCTQIATANITNANGPSVTTTVTNAACSGISNGTATANVIGGTTPYTYLWNPSAAATATATGLAAGNYSVIVTDAGGCSQTSVVVISNGTGPTANAGTNVSVNSGSATTLTASGGGNYLWNSGQSTASISVSPTATTVYCVVVTDVNGCFDSSCVTVFIIPEPVPCGEFYLPNAFSPNNDNENDVFQAYIAPSCVAEFKLIIYNRWGEKIFETTDVTKSWNGEWQGTLSNAGVYAYYCKAVLTNGKEIVKRGNVSLVR